MEARIALEKQYKCTSSSQSFVVDNAVSTILTVSIHCAPEMSEIDCIGRIESFWPKFVRGGKYFRMFSYS